MKNKITDEDKKEFQRYILDSPFCVDELINSLGKEGKKLDLSPESLKFVDQLLKEKIIKRNDKASTWNELKHQESDKLTQEETKLIVRLSYYLAEVLIRNLNAKWDIETKPRHASFKRAVLRIDGMLNGVDTQKIIYNVGRTENARSLYEWYLYIKNK